MEEEIVILEVVTGQANGCGYKLEMEEAGGRRIWEVSTTFT